MRVVRSRSSWLAVVALMLSACGPAGATPTQTGGPSATPTPTASATPTGSPSPIPVGTPTPTATPAPTPKPTSAPTPTALQKPPAPTNFTATWNAGPCPSGTPGGGCGQMDFAWQSTAATGAWFKIYRAFTEEGGGTCADVQAAQGLALQTQPNARTAQLFMQMAPGAGGPCLWISAANSAGESPQVLAS